MVQVCHKEAHVAIINFQFTELLFTLKLEQGFIVSSVNLRLFSACI